MNVTIKNLKIAKFNSEETLCFQATVYIDGKRAFTAQNDGHGGSNYYDGDRAKIRAAEEWAAVQPGAYGVEDLDTVIGELILTIEVEREVKKIRRKLAIYDAPDILTWNRKPDDAEGRKFIAKNHPNAVILNDVSFSEAIEFYKALPAGGA